MLQSRNAIFIDPSSIVGWLFDKVLHTCFCRQTNLLLHIHILRVFNEVMFAIPRPPMQRKDT